MKTWYHAVCEKCGECKVVLVNDPKTTAAYVTDEENQSIFSFMLSHYGCPPLKIVWRDEELDELREQGYFDSFANPWDTIKRQDKMLTEE